MLLFEKPNIYFCELTLKNAKIIQNRTNFYGNYFRVLNVKTFLMTKLKVIFIFCLR